MQPVDIVQAYFDRVYGDRDVEAIRQLCADPYRRHEPAGEVHLLTHDDQIARVNGVIAGSAGADGATFEFITVAMDGGADLVTVVFDMTLPADSPWRQRSTACRCPTAWRSAAASRSSASPTASSPTSGTHRSCPAAGAEAVAKDAWPRPKLSSLSTDPDPAWLRDGRRRTAL